MAADWFCRVRGQLRGPLSPQELKALAQSGQLAPDSLVRQGSAGAWVKALRVKGLFQPGAEAAKTRGVETPAGSSVQELPEVGAVDEFGLPAISTASAVLPIGLPVGSLPGADLPTFDDASAKATDHFAKANRTVASEKKGMSFVRMMASGVLALALSLVGLCLIVVPVIPIVLGIAGTLLGIRALLLSMRRSTPILFMSAAAILMGLLATAGGLSLSGQESAQRSTRWQERVNAWFGGALSGSPIPDQTPPTTLPTTWYQAPDEVAIVGGVTHVSLTGAYVGRLPGRDQAPADEPVYLMITVRLQNRGQAKVDYTSWSGTVGGATPILGDDLGSKFKRVATPRGVAGQLRHESLYPGDVKVDLLVFERPVPNYKKLELTLPAVAIGETEPIRFKIPRSMVQVDTTPSSASNSVKPKVREIRSVGEDRQPVEDGPKKSEK